MAAISPGGVVVLGFCCERGHDAGEIMRVLATKMFFHDPNSGGHLFIRWCMELHIGP